LVTEQNGKAESVLKLLGVGIAQADSGFSMAAETQSLTPLSTYILLKGMNAWVKWMFAETDRSDESLKKLESRISERSAAQPSASIK